MMMHRKSDRHDYIRMEWTVPEPADTVHKGQASTGR
jgi:hypothetical protein